LRRALVFVLCGCGRIDFDSRLDAAGGGASDATSDSASGFCTAGAASGCPANATFCEDFETSSGMSFPAWDRVAMGNWNTAGPVDPSTTLRADGLPCRGARSLHGHDVGSAQATYTETMIARPNPLYLRLWFRIEGTSPNTDFELVGLHDAADFAFVHIGIAPSGQFIGTNPVGFSTTLAMQGPAAIVADRWQCLQMRWQFSQAATGSLAIDLDGVSAIAATNVVTDGSQPLDHLIVGVVTGLNETGTYDVDVDEVAVSGSPIPCN
jgi:hypothetical protein